MWTKMRTYHLINTLSFLLKSVKSEDNDFETEGTIYNYTSAVL